MSFDSPRDAVLYDMAINGWAIESAGDRDSVTGWFAWMTNAAAELPEIEQAFEHRILDTGLKRTAELIGHWLINELADEPITVEGYESAFAAKRAFDQLKVEYRAWLAGGVE